MYHSYVIQEKTTGEIDRVYGYSYAEAMILNNDLNPDEYYLISIHEEDPED